MKYFGVLTVISFRAAESLLLLAEIDLSCDDPSQAKAKLDAAEAILGAVVRDSCDSSRKTKKKILGENSATGASPRLPRADFALPSWLDHAADCGCYPCSNAAAYAVMAFRYFNAMGSWHHQSNNPTAAGAHLEGAKRILLKALEKLKQDIVTAAAREAAGLKLLESLHAQIECHGRDGDLGQCWRALELVQAVVDQMPKGFMTQNVWLRTRVGHWALILSSSKEGADLSDIENRLAKCSLTPSVGNELKVPTVGGGDSLKTPAPARTRGVPRKPVKRVLPKN